jgi:glutamate synthase large subunit
MEMVELSLIDNKHDTEELLGVIEKHYNYTGSETACAILNDKKLLQYFIKVTPIEYKKMLHHEQMVALQKRISDIERDY